MKLLTAGYNEEHVFFLNLELELGLTYCKMALVTADEARARRNVANARTALSTFDKLNPRINIMERDEVLLSEKHERLATLLTQLERDLENP